MNKFNWTATIVTGIGAFCAGWWLKPASLLESATDSGSARAPLAGTAIAPGALDSPSSTTAKPREGQFPPSAFAEACQRAEALPAREFGQRLAELLIKPAFGDVLLERSALTSLLDGERMTETYEAYKRRTGTTSGDEHQVLRDLLLAASQRDGAGTMQRLMSLHPEGFKEIGSVLYGWAMTDPRAAVAWINAQPDESPQRRMSFRGLMSGLAAGKPEMAAQVFTTLAPEDRNEAALGFANSMVHNQGLAAFDNWVQSADPELAALAVRSAGFRIAELPPSESVPWMAQHSDVIPPGQAGAAAGKWFATSPDEAAAWFASWAADRPAESVWEFVQAAGQNPATQSAVSRWLESHQDHKAAAALKSILRR